jgi:hypothetical protein
MADAGAPPDFSCSGATLPTSAPATITITGQTFDEGQTATPLGGVAVAAFSRSGTMLAMTTSDSMGNFTLSIATLGAPVDGYLRGTKSGYRETNVWPAVPWSASTNVGEVALLQPLTETLLAALVGISIDQMKGQIFVNISDCKDINISGATGSSSPAGSNTFYIAGGTPSTTATSTDSEGSLLIANVPAGNATISAQSGTQALRNVVVVSKANVVTTVSVQP